MTPKKKRFSLSEFLLFVGTKIQFSSPDSSPDYGKPEEEEKKRGFSLLPYEKKIKLALAKSAEQSAVLTFLKKTAARLFSTRIRSFGVLFFACGFLQIFAYFLGTYVSFLLVGEEHLLFGVAEIFLALLLSFSRGSLREGVKKSFLFRFLLRPVLGVEEWQIPSEKGRDALWEMLLLGIFFGVVCVFIPPVWVVKVLLGILLFFLLFFRPEAGLWLCIAALLFSSFSAFAFWVCVTFAAFLWKCAVGKRSLVFSYNDLAVLLFLLPFSATEKGFSFSLCLFCLYFLFSGLIRTFQTMESVFRGICLLAFSGGVLLLAGFLLREFVPHAFLRVPDLERVFFLRPTPEVGLVFAMFLPLLAGFVGSLSSFSKRLFPFVTGLLCVAVLGVTRDGSVWICAFLGLALFALFTYRSALLGLVLISLSFITALNLLPAKMSRRALSLFGPGILVTLPGEESSSLMEFFLGQGGVFWVLTYLAVLGFAVFSSLRFPRTSGENSHSGTVLGALCSMGVFFLGSVQNLNLDARALALFLVLASLPGAANRCGKRQAVRLPY